MHELHYGDGGSFDLLKHAQPGRMVLASGNSVSYGCGAAYIFELLEVEGQGIPAAFFGSHLVADVTLDSAWKMIVIVILMNESGTDSWDPVEFGPFLKKLETAKCRASHTLATRGVRHQGCRWAVCASQV